ncbi:MAG TPA: hypothetical protein VJC18_08520, partial [bacterium]|nr:hypothetical protein [bacterium]
MNKTTLNNHCFAFILLALITLLLTACGPDRFAPFNEIAPVNDAPFTPTDDSATDANSESDPNTNNEVESVEPALDEGADSIPESNPDISVPLDSPEAIDVDENVIPDAPAENDPDDPSLDTTPDPAPDPDAGGLPADPVVDPDDADPVVAIEICDGFDNNLNGQIDEGVSITVYADEDGDGYGDPETGVLVCGPTAGYVTNAEDCDDNNFATNPGIIKDCSSISGLKKGLQFIDNDCDGVIDEDNACSPSPAGTLILPPDVTDDAGPTVTPLTPGTTPININRGTMFFSGLHLEFTPNVDRGYRNFDVALQGIGEETSATQVTELTQTLITKDNGGQTPFDSTLYEATVFYSDRTFKAYRGSITIDCDSNATNDGYCSKSKQFNLSNMEVFSEWSTQDIRNGEYAFFVAVNGMSLEPTAGQGMEDLNVQAFIKNTTVHPKDGNASNQHYL